MPWRKHFLVILFTAAYIGVQTSQISASCPQSLYTDSQGTIHSPGFNTTGRYDANMSCIYHIRVAVGLRITLEFKNLSILGSMPNCAEDSLEIIVGCSNISIGKFCSCSNLSMPDKIYSYDNCMTLLFKSDGSYQGKGFEAQYTTADNTAARLDPKNCSTDSVTPSHGTIYTPNWPLKYPESASCVWTFNPPQTTIVRFFFTSFQLDGDPICDPNRPLQTADQISINGTNTTGGQVIIEKRLCTLPFDAFFPIKDMKAIEVRFGSNSIGTNDGTGVLAGYATYIKGYVDSSVSRCAVLAPTSKPSSTAIPVTSTTPTTMATGCDRHLLGPNGRFSTPNYPQNYPKNINCVWRITLLRGATLSIRFENFYTEDCCDVVKISNSTFVIVRLSDNLGSFSIQPITALENNTVIEVTFSSDASVVYTGFIAHYSISLPPTPDPSTPPTTVPTTVPATTARPTAPTTVPTTTSPPFFGCGGMLNGSLGSFWTPGFPDQRDYDNNLNCTWTLRIPANGYLRLNYQVFYTELCCDFVELTDSAGQIIQKKSGLKPPFVVSVYGNTTLFVKVRFTSDSSVNKRGFLARYVIVSQPRTNTTLVPSVPYTTSVTGLPTFTSAPFSTTVVPIAPSMSSLAPVMSSSAVGLPPDARSLFLNVLQSLRPVIDEIEALLGGQTPPDDIEDVKNSTLQALQQVQNLLLATSPTHADGLVKRAIPEYLSPYSFRELLAKIQRRIN